VYLMSRLTALRIGLVVVNGFVAVTAICGAIWVVPTMPLEWIKFGPFTDWTIPAFALGFVGVIAAVTAVLVLIRPWAGALASVMAGVAMVVFELVEIGVVGWTLSDPSLEGFQKSLQVVYLVVGAVQAGLGTVLWAATRRSAPTLPLIDPTATPESFANRSMATIRRHPLRAYFVLAYGITWGAILAFLASIGFDLARVGMTEALVIFGFMAAGPSAAGVLLTALLDGRHGLRELGGRYVHLRVPVRWYALALLTTPLLLLGALVPLSTGVSDDYAPAFLAFGIMAGLLAGALEEIGWTGFATPRLLERFSPLRAGLTLGVAWAAWHALADFSGNATVMGIGPWLVWFGVYWLLPLTGYRVLMTWAYAHHRSLGLAVLMHASWTGWLAALTMEMPAGTGLAALTWSVPLAIGIWALVVVLVVRSPAAWRRTAALRPA
jgi:membrane protease YdiL (CAAX protease family)